ncbi:hypothetical protein [Streptomyces sp. 4F14]|uniref:hypothetical protein n=1 Tax=Streptomyces sp. 4F14 TaxID=3394380 RepID=UPI003A86D69D
MSSALYRYVLYLSEDDWEHLRDGFDRRVRRFRSKTKLQQIERVRDALNEASADRWPDEGEFRYAVYLPEDDFEFFEGSALHHKYGGVPRDRQNVISHEFALACGDRREA